MQGGHQHSMSHILSESRLDRHVPIKTAASLGRDQLIK